MGGVLCPDNFKLHDCTNWTNNKSASETLQQSFMLGSALSASCDDYCLTVDTADPDIQANLKCMAECTLEKWGDKAAPGPGEYVACEGECAGVKCDAYAGMCAGGSKVFASAAAVFLAATVAAAF